MIFLVVGLGSMGRRRVRLLKQISEDFEIIGVDTKKERREQAEKEYGITTTEDLEEALKNHEPDGVVISTSPLSHAKIINSSLKASCNVFTELNLVSDMYEENMKLAKEKGKVLFLSSTFLYREEVHFILKETEKASAPLNYNYHIGQYLPDWHPWESYKDYFVSDKRTNGCRELFAIELPWLIRTFGAITSIEVLSGKGSGLPVDYNDNYLLLLGHENGNKGVLAVDVVSRKAVRNLEIYGRDLYLTWDGSPTGLHLYDIENKEDRSVSLYDNIDKQEGYASFVVENAYRNELETFIGLIKGEKKAEYSFEDDLEVLSLIDRIEGN